MALVKLADNYGGDLSMKLYSLLLPLFLFGPQAQPALAEIIMFGDSIFQHRNEGVKKEIEEQLGEEIYNFAVSGAKSKEIAEQYYSLVKGPVKFEIIIDGGGNDILGAARDCKGNMTEVCYRLIADIANEFAAVFWTMAQDDQIRVFYLTPYYPQGFASGYENAVNLGAQIMQITCRDSKIECHFVDPRKEMVGNVLDWDGIHPNPAGIKILGNLISEAIVSARHRTSQ